MDTGTTDTSKDAKSITFFKNRLRSYVLGRERRLDFAIELFNIGLEIGYNQIQELLT